MVLNANQDLISDISEAALDERAIVERIYDAVMERRLPPGTKLGEAALSAAFGVGRSKVRRALLVLSSQGIVDLYSNRGAYISCPEPAEAHDIFKARLTIEPSIVRQMADNVDPDQITILSKHIQLEDAARAIQDRREIIRLSGEFHVKLAASTGNAVLTKIIRDLVIRTSLIIGLFGQSSRSSCPEHEHFDMLEAIRAGDAVAAERLIRDHLGHIEADLDLSAASRDRIDLSEILAS